MSKTEDENARKYGFHVRINPNPAQRIADECLTRMYAESPTVPMKTFVDAAVNEALEWASQQCECINLGKYEVTAAVAEHGSYSAALIRAGKSE